MGSISITEDGLASLGVVLPVVAGSAYCLWEFSVISRVDVDGEKHDGEMDTALLEYRKTRIDNMKYVGRKIAEGADSFLMAEYRYMAGFIIVFSALVFLASSVYTAIAFVVGCLSEILAGYIGMKIATYSNYRTTHECWRSLTKGYDVAIRSGAIVSFVLLCIAVINLFGLIIAFKASPRVWEGNDFWVAISGYSFGVSSIGLFGRVSGGIYTKAADIGADLSGKMDFGLTEDDYRNPACIADNVGDNVGGIVGTGADLFGSLAGSTCAALVIAGSSTDFDWKATMFPLLISSTGILVGILTIVTVQLLYKVRDAKDVELVLKRLVVIITLFETPVVYVLAHWCLPASFDLNRGLNNVTPLHCTICVWLGLWSGLIIGYVTEYYTSFQRGPVQEIAKAQRVSAGTGVILGLSVGYESCAIPVLFLASCVLISNTCAGAYGIALAALGMLSVMSMGLAIDAYDSIADNAGGIAEMCGLSTNVRDITDVLGGAGAIGHGFAIGSAALVSLALIDAFCVHTDIKTIDTLDKWYVTGLLVGGMLPYLFSSITMKSTGKAANDMVEECRRQFPGIIDREESPDYKRCIKISTEASLKAMGPAGLLAIGAPIAIGLLFGKKCTAGLLQGALVSGVQMAISMINTGGAWDNAKKHVEVSGIRDSEQHKNAMTCDIIGDPLKDVSGPSLNILVNLSSITGLVFGSLINKWSNEHGGPFWH